MRTPNSKTHYVADDVTSGWGPRGDALNILHVKSIFGNSHLLQRWQQSLNEPYNKCLSPELEVAVTEADVHWNVQKKCQILTVGNRWASCVRCLVFFPDFFFFCLFSQQLFGCLGFTSQINLKRFKWFYYQLYVYCTYM